MDSYSASLSNRRYPSGGSGLLSSSPATTKLRINQGSTLSNLSNNKKPRASSASVTRRNNSRYDSPSTLPLGGSGSFLTQQQAQMLRANGNALGGRDNDGGGKHGNFISSNPALNNSAGGAFIGDSRGDSYDQIRRNYEQNRLVNAHKSGYNNTSDASAVVLSNSNGYSSNMSNNINNLNLHNSYNAPPRAQSASGLSRAANSYNNAFSNANSANNSGAQSNAYLAMRQSTAGSASPPPELMNVGANNNNTSFGSGVFPTNSTPTNATNAANKTKFGIPLPTNTRGIANTSLSNNNITSGAYLNNAYGNTTVGSLMALSSNPVSPRNNRSSTEIIPANFMPAPILCAKSSYSATNKGVNRVASHNKRVSFSTPLTNSSPLQNPFMCQNIPAWNAANGITTTSNGNSGSSGNSGSGATSNGRYNSTAGGSTGGNTGGNSGLFRPASASAAMMSTATTHFLNNTLNTTNNTNNTNKNAATANANNVIINGVVLTGATVVTSVSNSRSESPVNTPLTVSTTPINLASAFNNLNAGSTPSHAQVNTPNMSKPPLFFSSIGGQQYENNAKSTIEGVASPKYTNNNAPRNYSSSPTVQGTLTIQANSPQNNNNNNTQSNSGENSPVNESSALPSIRLQQAPSPRPGSASNSNSTFNNNTQLNNNHTTSATAATTTNSNANNNNSNNSNNTSQPSSLVPLFTPSAQNSAKKGMVLSNSMENFASYGMTNDNISTNPNSLSKYHTHMSANNLHSGSNSDNNSVNSSTSINSGSTVPYKTMNTANNTATTNNNVSNNVPVAAGMKRTNLTTTHNNNNTTQTNPANNTNNANNTNTPLHLRRNGSAGSLAELNFLRISPPVVENSNGGKLSPKSAAIVNSIRDDSVLLQADSGIISANSGLANSKGKKKHSLTDQLAHIGANMSNNNINNVNSNSTTAASTPTLANHTSDTQGGKTENASFFQQSLNSAIAIGRSVVSNVQSLSPTLTSGKHYTNNNTNNNSSNNNTLSMYGTTSGSSNSLQSLTTKANDYAINTPTTNAYPISSPVLSPTFDIDAEESITGVGNSLVIVPCKNFSIGSYACRSPTKMSFYAEHCEYPFNHPYENSTVYLSIPYKEMTAITTVGMKFRFKIPRKCSMVLGEFDTQNALHLVTLELSHTHSMSVVRERVVPLVTAK